MNKWLSDYYWQIAKLESWHWGVVIYNQIVTWTAFAILAMFYFAISQILWFFTVPFSFVIAQLKSLLRRWVGTLAVSIWWLAPSRLSFSSLHHTLSSFSSKWKPPLSDTLWFSRKKKHFFLQEERMEKSRAKSCYHLIFSIQSLLIFIQEYILRSLWLEYFLVGHSKVSVKI